MSISTPFPDNSYPQLFTQKQWEALLANHQIDNLLPVPPVVKLFAPDGAATWLLSAIDSTDPDMAFGLCDLGVGFPELGYVSLREISSIRGALNLPVERDRYCDLKKPLKVYADLADVHRHISV